MPRNANGIGRKLATQARAVGHDFTPTLEAPYRIDTERNLLDILDETSRPLASITSSSSAGARVSSARWPSCGGLPRSRSAQLSFIAFLTP